MKRFNLFGSFILSLMVAVGAPSYIESALSRNSLEPAQINSSLTTIHAGCDEDADQFPAPNPTTTQTQVPPTALGDLRVYVKATLETYTQCTNSVSVTVTLDKAMLVGKDEVVYTADWSPSTVTNGFGPSCNGTTSAPYTFHNSLVDFDKIPQGDYLLTVYMKIERVIAGPNTYQSESYIANKTFPIKLISFTTKSVFVNQSDVQAAPR